MRMLECVPNFSEGRRREVIAAITASMAAVPGVKILDRHSDADHNRTVVTLAGPPDAVAQAAFRGIAEAARRIDLTQHTGQHPFIGAADVVPFVPLEDMSLDDAVAVARQVGQQVGQRLGLPVYLYGAAATRPERHALENIRRGGYAALRAGIGRDPRWQPDFGPAQAGPAGAVVIGARDFLIAFNVYLTTDDVAIARRIARAVRHSSGGLRYVKALGLQVGGRAQVSMNLTNFRRTPLPRVVELIRREAARYGVGVHHSELVGMIPQEALFEAARWYLQMDAFTARQVLEPRLAEAFWRPGRDVLRSLSDPDAPAPAGLALVAGQAALALGLLAKLWRRAAGEPARGQAWQAAAQDVLALAEADAWAYNDAQRAPRSDPERRALWDLARATAQAVLDRLKAVRQDIPARPPGGGAGLRLDWDIALDALDVALAQAERIVRFNGD